MKSPYSPTVKALVYLAMAPEFAILDGCVDPITLDVSWPPLTEKQATDCPRAYEIGQMIAAGNITDSSFKTLPAPLQNRVVFAFRIRHELEDYDVKINS